MTVNEIIEDNTCYIEIVNGNDDVDCMWGITANSITLDQITELQNGKYIYFDDGEYAHIIYIKR